MFVDLCAAKFIAIARCNTNGNHGVGAWSLGVVRAGLVLHTVAVVSCVHFCVLRGRGHSTWNLYKTALTYTLPWEKVYVSSLFSKSIASSRKC